MGHCDCRRSALTFKYCKLKVTYWELFEPLLTIHTASVHLCSWMKDAELRAVMCKGVCVSSGFGDCTFFQHTSFTYCPDFEGELSCMFAHRRKHNLRSPMVRQEEVKSSSSIQSLLEMLILWHFVIDQSHCRKQARKIVPPDDLDEQICWFHSSPLLHIPHMQVALVTQAEKF